LDVVRLGAATQQRTNEISHDFPKFSEPMSSTEFIAELE
jgi:hypothetical protein